MQGCCSSKCVTTIHLPEVEQKAIRSGIKNGNKIFKKGKSEFLTFKNTIESHGIFVTEGITTTLKQETKIKKIFIGKGVHFYAKTNIAQFLIQENEIKVGDTILIKGKTTGEQQLIIDEMYVNKMTAEKAVVGENMTLKLAFRIRLSDKLYKITNGVTK